MNYTKVNLFGAQSKGTFDDICDQKYSTIQDAYAQNDYVECNFVKDDEGILYIEAYHIKKPEEKLYHRLTWQDPRFGLDTIDDQLGCEMATKLFLK